MNHADAADLRETLNDMPFVQSPHDDGGGELFRLVRVSQPGYLNGGPMYEVLVDVDDPESIHLPSDLLEAVTDHGGYLRIDDGTIHIRDWRTETTDRPDTSMEGSE